MTFRPPSREYSLRALARHIAGTLTNPISRLIGRIWDSRLDNPVRRRALERAARKIITPFTPYLICDYYLAPEVDELGIRFLNKSAVDLATSSDSICSNSVVFVQVDQLESFETHHLSRFKAKFVLISAKWHLPATSVTDCVRRISRSSNLAGWFARDFQSEDPVILPFPLGVNFWDAPKILRARTRFANQRKVSQVYVPQVTIHPHLDSSSRKVREDLYPFSDRRRHLRQYLRRIAKSRYVVCPPGDRPDTYRKWESIALGAVPVTLTSVLYDRIFGNRVCQVESLVEVAKGNLFLSPSSIDFEDNILSPRHWEVIVRKPLQKGEGVRYRAQRNIEKKS